MHTVHYHAKRFIPIFTVDIILDYDDTMNEMATSYYNFYDTYQKVEVSNIGRIYVYSV